MSKSVHDQMLEEGARTAPEPETAEQRSMGRKVGPAAGGIAAGGAALAKVGILGKIVFAVAGWHLFLDAISWGGWYTAAAVAATLAVVLVLILRRES